MRRISRIGRLAAAAAATGLAALGMVAATGGEALAGTGVPATACTIPSTGLGPGTTPSCGAGTSTIDNPTSITVSVDPSYFSVLGGLIEGLGVTASWTLTCVVNGAPVTEPAGSSTFTATSSATSSTVIDLQAAVGSPEPNSCTLSNLTASSTVSLTTLGASSFSFGVSAAADTALPGSIWQPAGSTSDGATATLCADDRANGNAGSVVQGYKCISDLAQFWVYTASGQFVHNGDCMAVSGGAVVLAACDSGDPSQAWTVTAGSGSAGTISTGGQCLTAPSARNGTGLTVAACTGAASQKWTAPASPGPVCSGSITFRCAPTNRRG